jgi:hypothetical protein
MQLTTPVAIPNYKQKIKYKSKMLFIGSCFSDNIGNWLYEHHFSALCNPLGTMYNPCSVALALENIIESKKYVFKDLHERKGQYFNFDFHGSFVNTDKDLAIDQMNKAVESAHKYLNSLDYLFVTFGTAWIFELKTSGKVVANCHKMPETLFNRRKLSVEEIFNIWIKIQEKLFAKFPNLNIVYTVSPIRHLKDGAIENMLSKSALFLAIEQLVSANQNAHYFPAYEILNDELRDYRFYASDMVHLSETSIEYIRNKFSTHFFSIETQNMYKSIAEIIAASKHRPLHPKSIEYQQFCKKMIAKTKALNKTHPEIDFSEEILKFSKFEQ